jgi:hypothetical protein
MSLHLKRFPLQGVSTCRVTNRDADVWKRVSCPTGMSDSWLGGKGGSMKINRIGEGKKSPTNDGLMEGQNSETYTGGPERWHETWNIDC